jgi:inner membrane protein
MSILIMVEESMKPEFLWLSAGLLLMALEIVVPGFFIFWFGAGAILTALGVFLGMNPAGASTWFLFFGSSFGFLMIWHFLLKRYFGKTVTDTVRDPTLAELKGVAAEEIRPGHVGEVELFRAYHSLKKWRAESADTIEPGDEVEVIEAKGVRLVVRKISS